MARVLLRYLIVKLKILAGSLPCARDQSELRFFKGEVHSKTKI